ncbi:hypothetical protein FJTKL_00424 [Diaporthe vaccinii]|uniref:Uncharacterized protein n=1 Tax=Diaporthe vaccinii TaxID=105482 RepID=A0ABR4E2W1_9PEZI
MYYLFACPEYKKYGSVIPEPPRLMDYLNLAQLLIQWLCSLLLLGFVLVVRESAHANVETDPTTAQTTEATAEQTADPTTDPTTTDETSPSARVAVLLVVIHAALCVFWAILAGEPSRDWLDLPFVIIMGINYACINPLFTVTTGIAYGLQASAAGAAQDRTALSRTTLVLQIIVFLALAVLWPVRLRLPENLKDSGLWLVYDWYPLVGWPCVNNALVAVGQCIVLHAVGGAARGGAQSMSRETQPLLAHVRHG